MNDSGRKATTFVFAGYKKEMDEFVQYNAGLESRIKYRFHFDDYSVPELVTIINIKMKSKGYKMDPAAEKPRALSSALRVPQSISSIIEKGTTQDLRSKYNGRLTDNLLQWASDEMNTRLDLNASGDQLITLAKSDFEAAIKRFNTTKPPSKADPALLGGEEELPSPLSPSHRLHALLSPTGPFKPFPAPPTPSQFLPERWQVEKQLKMWNLQEYSQLFVRAGYRQLMDLAGLQGEKDIRAIGVTKEADVRRAMSLVQRLQQARAAHASPFVESSLREEHRQMSLEMDSLYIDPDTADIKTWLEKRGLGEFAKSFDKHKIDFEVLGDLTYDDIKEIGIVDVGPRRKVYRAISQWKEERDVKKNEAIVARMRKLNSVDDVCTHPMPSTSPLGA
ncbi:MAG: hypothetical protein SGPRY_000446 [Prymnesium sp.]